MSEAYPWDECSERKPVDSGGCLFGEIDRPARAYLEWIDKETQQYKLKTPEAPEGYITIAEPVSLEANR